MSEEIEIHLASRRVFEDDPEFNEYPHLEPILDPTSGNQFKLLRGKHVTFLEGKIESIILELHSLKGKLDIFNEHGLSIVGDNLFVIHNRITNISKET